MSESVLVLHIRPSYLSTCKAGSLPTETHLSVSGKLTCLGSLEIPKSTIFLVKVCLNTNLSLAMY